MQAIKTTSFGHFIRSEREKQGWTQTEFGAKVGINAFAISKIENGTQKFNKTKLETLAELFGMDFQKIKDLFYADKFAVEAYNNQCSDDVFTVAESGVRYLKAKSAKQGNLDF